MARGTLKTRATFSTQTAFYSKKHYKTILQKCQNVADSVCSSHRRRDRCVSRSPVGELSSPCVANVPTVTGTTDGTFSFKICTNFHLSTSSSCTLFFTRCSSGSHQSVGSTRPVSQSLRWDCCGCLKGLWGAGQRRPFLFLQLAHRDEAAAFGGVRSGGAAVFQDAESLV